MNTSADGQDTKALRETLSLQTTSIGPTWPLGGDMAKGRPPFIAIDHIFTKNLRVSNIRKIDYSDLTDHSLVLADVEG